MMFISGFAQNPGRAAQENVMITALFGGLRHLRSLTLTPGERVGKAKAATPFRAEISWSWKSFGRTRAQMHDESQQGKETKIRRHLKKI
jgi:hypothetical protein